MYFHNKILITVPKNVFQNKGKLSLSHTVGLKNTLRVQGIGELA